MTLLRFPEGHVAAVRSLAAGRASSVSDRERVSLGFFDPGVEAVPMKRIWKHPGLK